LCHLCSSGQYSNAKGSTSCTACPAGTWNGGVGVTSCTLCAAGTFSAAVGAYVIGTCANCTAGQYSNAGSSQCTDCPAGQYSTADKSSTCSKCAANKSCPAKSKTASACVNCLAGQTSVSGGACTACPGGQTSISGGSCYTPRTYTMYQKSGIFDTYGTKLFTLTNTTIATCQYNCDIRSNCLGFDWFNNACAGYSTKLSSTGVNNAYFQTYLKV
jgi:hypothetical protein